VQLKDRLDDYTRAHWRFYQRSARSLVDFKRSKKGQPSGCDFEFLDPAGIHSPNRLLQAATHFFLSIPGHPVLVEFQHLVPKLNFSLEQVTPGGFHIFCPIWCRVLTRLIFWNSS
jgi:hypothetical protein